MVWYFVFVCAFLSTFCTFVHIYLGSISKEIKGGPYNLYCGFRFDTNLIGVTGKAKGGMDGGIY